MAPGTVWRRALRRVDRRRAAYLASRADRDALLLAQAVRLANSCYSLAYGLARTRRSVS
jgi:hypothetical protein